MPALTPTEFYAEITWLGVAPNPEGHGNLRSVPQQTLTLSFDGAQGEIRHSGRTRPSCSRVVSQHRKGTEIANTRQISVISQEDLDAIAAGCALDRIDPALLGATIVVRGIPDFSHVPPSSRLQGPDGSTLIIDMQNRPCALPAREIDADAPGHGKSFKTAAKGRRGVTAWVERPGTLMVGQRMRLHVPDQRVWAVK